MPNRKQINEHLYIDAVENVAEFEFFGTGFIVHNADIAFAAFVEHVNAVDDTLYGDLFAAGSEKPVCTNFGISADGHFEGVGLEFRNCKFRTYAAQKLL